MLRIGIILPEDCRNVRGKRLRIVATMQESGVRMLFFKNKYDRNLEVLAMNDISARLLSSTLSCPELTCAMPRDRINKKNISVEALAQSQIRRNGPSRNCYGNARNKMEESHSTILHWKSSNDDYDELTLFWGSPTTKGWEGSPVRTCQRGISWPRRWGKILRRVNSWIQASWSY